MIHNITDRERSLESLVAQLSQGRDALAKRVEALEAAADYVVRRLSVDIDDGGRPDQWSMEDMVRKLHAAMKADQP